MKIPSSDASVSAPVLDTMLRYIKKRERERKKNNNARNTGSLTVTRLKFGSG